MGQQPRPGHAAFDRRGSAPPLARCGHTSCSSASAAHAAPRRNCAGTYSSISETSSPSLRNSPPQSGQADSFGSCVLRLTWQMIGQRPPCWFRWSIGRRRGCWRRLSLRLACASRPEFACSSSSRNSSCSICRVQLLRLASKLHALQLGDQQLQMLDLALAREQLLVLRQRLSAFNAFRSGKQGSDPEASCS